MGKTSFYFLLVFFCVHFCTGQGPPAGSVTINSVATLSSCGVLGGIDVTLNTGATALSISFTPYIATLGPLYGPTDITENCAFVVNISLPSGWQFTVNSVTFSGEASLPLGISAAVSSILFFNLPQQCIVATGYTGPLLLSAFIDSDTCDAVYLNWSSCSSWTQLYFNTMVHLKADSYAVSHLSIGELVVLTGVLQTSLLTWQTCT